LDATGPMSAWAALPSLEAIGGNGRKVGIQTGGTTQARPKKAAPEEGAAGVQGAGAIAVTAFVAGKRSMPGSHSRAVPSSSLPIFSGSDRSAK
jgi:hypothetical protein